MTFRDWWHLLARYTSVVESKDSVRTALRIMAHRGFRHLPVVSDGKLFGVAAAGDLIDLFSSEKSFDLASKDPLTLPPSEIKQWGDWLNSSLENQVSTISNPHPVTITPDYTILDAIKVMGEKNIGSLLILDDWKLIGPSEKAQTANPQGKLVGIVTLRDIVSILAAYAPFRIRVEECMTSRVSTVKEKDSIYSAMKLMSQERVRRLPVVTSVRNEKTGQSILGMITNKMILRYLESVISYNMLDVGSAIMQPVKTVMQSHMPLIDPKEDCGNAAYLMREIGTGGFAVVDSRGLIGVITERDLITRLFKKKGPLFFSNLFEKGTARMQA